MKRPPLRDLRGAAEAAARDYADRHREHDRFIETRLTAKHDQTGWKIVACVADPDRVQVQAITIPGMGTTQISYPAFAREWKDHVVEVRGRKP